MGRLSGPAVHGYVGVDLVGDLLDVQLQRRLPRSAGERNPVGIGPGQLGPSSW